MAKRKVEIPKGAWLDKKGQRWMKVTIDVDDFRDRVNQQYPSLERLRNLTFFPMGNKVLRK